MINREEYLDDYGTQVDPLFDMVDELQKENEALKGSIRDLLDNENTYRMSKYEAKSEELMTLINK